MNFLRRCATILAGYVAGATAAFMVPTWFFFFGFPDNISPSDMPDAIRGVALGMLLVGGVLLVPTMVVIDPQGMERAKWFGFNPAIESLMGTALDTLNSM